MASIKKALIASIITELKKYLSRSFLKHWSMCRFVYSYDPILLHYVSIAIVYRYSN